MILLKVLALKQTIKKQTHKNIFVKEIEHLMNSANSVKTINFYLNYKKKNSFLNLNNKIKLTRQNLINYIIKINLTPTNTFLNVTDVKGNLKLALSAGNLNIKNKQKTKQPNTLIQMLKILFLKSKFLTNKTITLQFKNIKPYHESIIINLLKEKIFIKSLKSYNLYPHNGCRPKKLKRFKKRTKRVTLN